jgi:hypothetical protein
MHIPKNTRSRFKSYPIKTPASALDTLSITDPRVLYDHTIMLSDDYGVWGVVDLSTLKNWGR